MLVPRSAELPEIPAHHRVRLTLFDRVGVFLLARRDGQLQTVLRPGQRTCREWGDRLVEIERHRAVLGEIGVKEIRRTAYSGRVEVLSILIGASFGEGKTVFAHKWPPREAETLAVM